MNGRDWRLFGRLHTKLYKRLGGRFVDSVGLGRKVLLLTTTGRKSGKQRTTPLVYMPHRHNPNRQNHPPNPSPPSHRSGTRTNLAQGGGLQPPLAQLRQNHHPPQRDTLLVPKHPKPLHFSDKDRST